jgi:hypothetical protein
MRARPFPSISIAMTVASAAVLATSSTISGRHCAFGFGGFQCNSPFSGYGDMLLTGTLGALAVLIVTVPIAAWRLIAWMRAR